MNREEERHRMGAGSADLLPASAREDDLQKLTRALKHRRKDNLKKRADSKIQKKKDKRDKKLLRAGFEGRKIGPIQKNK